MSAVGLGEGRIAGIIDDALLPQALGLVVVLDVPAACALPAASALCPHAATWPVLASAHGQAPFRASRLPPIYRCSDSCCLHLSNAAKRFFSCVSKMLWPGPIRPDLAGPIRIPTCLRTFRYRCASGSSSCSGSSSSS